MAYLTEYSFNQLIQNVEVPEVDRIDKYFFKKNIFDNDYLYYFFNQFELKNLFKEKLLVGGNESNFKMVYQEVPKRVDRSNYVLKIEGNVKYHKNNSCKALNYGFKNFFIPEPIAILREDEPDKHEKLVNEIREWFEQNNYTVQRYIDEEINDRSLTLAFNKKFPTEFEIEPITISANEKNQFQWYIEKKSSGNREIENSFDNNKFLQEIGNLIYERDELCNSYTMKNLSRYDFLINRENNEIEEYLISAIEKGYLKNVEEVFLENYGLPRLKEFWDKHRNLKSKALNLLSDFYKWTYNFNENSFDEVFLETYNLKPCRQCYERLSAEELF